MSTAYNTTMLPFYMTMAWSKVDIQSATSLGRLLQAKRDALNGTVEQVEQADVALAIGFSQSYVSQIERGLADNRVPLWPSRKQLALLRAYRFTPDEIFEVVEKFDLDISLAGSRNYVAAESHKVESFRSSENFVYYPVYTSASAGTGDPELVEGEVAAIPESALRSRGITEENRHEAMPVKVNGNCLVSQNVRFSDKNISHGDHVFVHLKAPPKTGDRVCCFDHTDDQLIIKFFDESQDPSNPDLITFFDARGMQYVRNTVDIEYVGVVFWRSGGL